MNKTRLSIIWFFVAAALMLPAKPVFAGADSTQPILREYQIKAAFIYNFIKFTDWPEPNVRDVNEPIVIGILGEDPFGESFEPLKNKLVKGKRVTIKRFGSFEVLEKNSQFDSLKKCSVLFISSSEEKRLGKITGLLRNKPVLTIVETENFVASGGIINFRVNEQKVIFEINQAIAEKVNLRLSSQLLRLASQVVK